MIATSTASLIFLSDPLAFQAGDANLYRYVGNDPVNKIDPDGLEEFPLVQFDGKTWRMTVKATGTSAADILAAEKLAIAKNAKFPGARALKATWHHKSFSSTSGNFVMELVSRSAHKKYHAGGFARYLDWVGQTIKTGNVNKLSDELATAIIRTLKIERLGNRVSSRLQNSTADFIVRKLRDNGYKVVITEGGEVTAELIGKRVGRKLLGTVITKGAKGLPAVTAIFAAGDAFANTGEINAAALAAMRDIVSADLVEGAFRLSVIQGAETVGDYLIDPVGIARKKFSTLTERERREYLQEVQSFISRQEDFGQSSERFQKEREARGVGFWEGFGNTLKDFWDSL